MLAARKGGCREYRGHPRQHPRPPPRYHHGPSPQSDRGPPEGQLQLRPQHFVWTFYSAAQIVMFCFVLPRRNFNNNQQPTAVLWPTVQSSNIIMSRWTSAERSCQHCQQQQQQQSASPYPSMSAPLPSHFNINWFSQANNYRRQSLRSWYLCAGWWLLWPSWTLRMWSNVDKMLFTDSTSRLNEQKLVSP